MKFQIIDKKQLSAKSYPLLGYILVGSILLLIAVAGIGRFTENAIIELIIYVLLGVIVIIGVFLFSLKPNIQIEKIGELELTSNDLILDLGGAKINSNITSVSKLHLKYRGYKGEFLSFISPSFVPENGTGNDLSFNIEDKSYRIEILLENRKQKEFIKRLLKRHKGKITYP